MAIIFDVQQNELIIKTAEKLKEVKEITPPAWSIFVKTGAHKERPPIKEDWWYDRCAAVLRSVAILGPVGVNKLRVKYGGRKNRGMKPEKFVRGSGNILRKSLQQLESAGLIKQDVRGNHKGRVITPKGQSLLAQIAQSIKNG
jgi:small subunit ribosomal protein S19e